ncbi:MULTISPECIES: flagellin [Thalassobaculum]|uniref:Flagellin n=1 Tax=Thalassobaculum litoreum DSM 18839 TaxID=1123362 RepID=A0A8G2EXQ8_9PROT|nr:MULTISPECIES: flagellin [Thalassobaculum]SDF51143.1 flagellin [Thalassobaculum litoreum DSM 18839]
MLSINTNSSAMAAVQMYNSASNDLSQVQKRISTGLKVADGFDDASTFAVAQRLRSDIKAFDKIDQSMNGVKGSVEVAMAGATAVSDLTGSIREKVTQLADDSISAETRASYTEDLTSMLAQVDSFIANSNFDGSNLLQTASTDLSFVAAADGTTMTVSAADIETAKTTLDGAVDVSDAANARTTLAALDTFETAVNSAISSLGSDGKALDMHSDFIGKLSDATEKGLGNMVDADLAQEAANQSALQVKQQLAVQALSSAASAPMNILSLFR